MFDLPRRAAAMIALLTMLACGRPGSSGGPTVSQGDRDGGATVDAGTPDGTGDAPDGNTADTNIAFIINNAAASSSLPGWAETNVYDGDPSTAWSSRNDPIIGATEWLAFWWSEGMQPTNYVKLLPRYNGNAALGFPIDFTVNYSNGSAWVPIAHYTGYPIPSRGDWIVLELPATVTANGIQVVATRLGVDTNDKAYLQIAEVGAGYDSGFEQLSYVGNALEVLPGKTQIAGVRSNAFNPNRFSHWDYDDRGVVIAPAIGLYRNIYAPQAVNTGGASWTVYFGGWDGEIVATPNDQISVTTTDDNFGTFGAHALAIGNGSYVHCNNDSVLQLGPNDWRMVYTTYDGTLNKPGYATSNDGVHWTPSSGNAAYLLDMAGYSNWAAADVNGGNAIFRDPSGTWHLYFVDFSASSPGGVQHATSADGVHYVYQGQALATTVVPQDLKAFTYAGTMYYVGAYHLNTQKVWTTVSTSLTSLGSLTEAFPNEGAADQYIVAAGIVQDRTRVEGILYGASSVPTLDANQIYASWLQKKVVFQNSDVRWGDIERGFGPDGVRVSLAAGDSLETGKFYVYDSDGTTLLYTSPTVTLREGDTWSYSGP
jgi:hypothetical protein